MKYSKWIIAVLAAFLAGGCSSASAAGLSEKETLNRESILGVMPEGSVIKIVEGKSGTEGLPDRMSAGSYKEGMEEPVLGTDFAVSAGFGENSIILSEPSDKKVLNEIPIVGGVNKVFINMRDGQNGYMLYCSMPKSGETQMMFYVTKNRWQTYSKMDIGSTLDGYPAD